MSFFNWLFTPFAARARSTAADSSQRTWRLDDPLYSFATLDARGRRATITTTIGKSCEGTLVFGRPASAKTSGSAANIARAMLLAGYGGLVLCAKVGEADTWRARAKATGRTDDLIFVTEDGTAKLNFLSYELEGGRNIEGVVGLLTKISEVLSPGDGRQDVWEKSGKELLRNALDLLRLSKEAITAASILSACIDDDAIRGFVEAAKNNIALTEDDRIDLDAINGYYIREVFKHSDKTRSSLTMSLSAMLGSFKRGTMRKLFSSETTVRPTDTRDGKIIVVDLPVKKFNDLGILAAAVWKSSFQNTMENIVATDSTRPVFLFADECQFFTAASDADFQSTARSSRITTVYLTQNFPNLKNKYGGDSKGEAKAKALLGSMATKIWHANDCPETNGLAAETIAKSIQERESRSSNASFGGEQNEFQGGAGTTTSIVLDYQLHPIDFQTLATGGAEHDHQVTAILFQGGKEFPNGKRFTHIIYDAIYE